MPRASSVLLLRPDGVVHKRIGARLHRVELPVTGLGWTSPPVAVDVKMQRTGTAWTARVPCSPHDAAALTAWLLGQGAMAVDRSGDLGAPVLRGRFPRLAPALESTLAQGRVELMTLDAEGAAALVVRAGEDHVVRLLQRLGHAEGSLPQAASLTARQAELLRYCVGRGYYAIPRHATLRLLAQELGISTTSLSLALRRAEAKIILSYEAQARTASDLVHIEAPLHRPEARSNGLVGP